MFDNLKILLYNKNLKLRSNDQKKLKKQLSTASKKIEVAVARPSRCIWRTRAAFCRCSPFSRARAECDLNRHSVRKKCALLLFFFKILATLADVCVGEYFKQV